jgi:hypothetical protein
LNYLLYLREMSEAKKELIERALASLKAKNNEPLNWLIGDALREHSDWPAHPHFLLTALSRPRTGSLALWNASIHEFRRLLTNPSAAPQKAMGDLRSSGQDADNRLRSLFAEVQTVLVLKKGGFSNFAVVPPSKVAMPDFTATFERNRARVEVKNLREPSDQLRTVAAEEWEKQRSSQPCRYNFHAALRHSSTGAISAAAEKRLRTIIRQFPDMKRPLKETLDGGISVQMERLDGSTNPSDGFLHARILKDAEPGRIVIVSSFRQEHLDPNVLELQRLFLRPFGSLFAHRPSSLQKKL